MSGLGTGALGLGRQVLRTVGGWGLDVVSGGARATEAVSARLAGRERGAGVLRVDVAILTGPDGPLCSPDAVVPALAAADRIFTAQADTRVRTTGIRVVAEPAPPAALDPRADRGLLVDDLLGRTAFYRRHCSAPALPAVAAPVTVVVVRSIAGRATGCSLGAGSDWVIVEASLFDPDDRQHYDETVLAHELGHNLNLPHHRDPANLLHPVSSPPDGRRGTALTGWQAAVVQASRRVVPGPVPARP